METSAQVLADLATFVFNASLKATVVLVLVLLLQKLCGSLLSANGRYLLWLSVLISLITPLGFETAQPRLDLLLPDEVHSAVPYESPVSVAPATASAEPLFLNPDLQTAASVLPGTASEPGTSASFSITGWFWLLPYLWLAGVLVVLAVTAISTYRFSRLLRRSTAAPAALQGLLQECMEQVGSKTTVRLQVTAELQAPLVAGLLRPVLLWPQGLEAQLTRTHIRHVFMHELMHVKRLDILSSWLVMLVQALHWFNPAVWIAFSCMRHDREMACDAATLACLDPQDGRAYGHTLIQLGATLPRQGGALHGLGILDTHKQLRRRIHMLVHASFSRRVQSGIAALLFLPLAVVAFSQPVPAAKREAQVARIMQQSAQLEAEQAALAQQSRQLTQQEEQAARQLAELADSVRQTAQAEHQAAQEEAAMVQESQQRAEQGARQAAAQSARQAEEQSRRQEAARAAEQRARQAAEQSARQVEEQSRRQEATRAAEERARQAAQSARQVEEQSRRQEAARAAEERARQAAQSARQAEEQSRREEAARAAAALATPPESGNLMLAAVHNDGQFAQVNDDFAAGSAVAVKQAEAVHAAGKICRRLSAKSSKISQLVCDTAANWADFDQRIGLNVQQLMAVSPTSTDAVIELELKVCRNEERPGGHIKNKVCRTADEWAAIDTQRQLAKTVLNHQLQEYALTSGGSYTVQAAQEVTYAGVSGSFGSSFSADMGTSAAPSGE